VETTIRTERGTIQHRIRVLCVALVYTHFLTWVVGTSVIAIAILIGFSLLTVYLSIKTQKTMLVRSLRLVGIVLALEFVVMLPIFLIDLQQITYLQSIKIKILLSVLHLVQAGLVCWVLIASIRCFLLARQLNASVGHVDGRP
jgi:hypothetical protein